MMTLSDTLHTTRYPGREGNNTKKSFIMGDAIQKTGAPFT